MLPYTGGEGWGGWGGGCLSMDNPEDMSSGLSMVGVTVSKFRSPEVHRPPVMRLENWH